jgi:hypothetical protein
MSTDDAKDAGPGSKTVYQYVLHCRDSEKFENFVGSYDADQWTRDQIEQDLMKSAIASGWTWDQCKLA